MNPHHILELDIDNEGVFREFFIVCINTTRCKA